MSEKKETNEANVQNKYKDTIFADFLAKNRAEAIAVCIFEYDEEKHLRHEREVWKNKGIEIGHEATLVRDVEFVMESFKVDLQSACKGLKITVSEYERYKDQMSLRK